MLSGYLQNIAFLFLPQLFYLTFMNSNISCNEGKQQIDRHDLFTQASHPLNPTLGGKINILSIHLFTVRQKCYLASVPEKKAQAVILIGDAHTVSQSTHVNHWLTVTLPTRMCSWINIFCLVLEQWSCTLRKKRYKSCHWVYLCTLLNPKGCILVP